MADDAAVVDISGDGSERKEPALNEYFKTVIKMKVSDLHLKAGRPALTRMKGDLRPLTGGPLTDGQICNGIFELLSEEQKQLYHDNGAVDFAHNVGPPGDAAPNPDELRMGLKGIKQAATGILG